MARAQSAKFTSYAQFNDTLVAQFNRGDFTSVEAFGSPALRKIEPLGSMARYLTGVQQKTGRITSTAVLTARGQRHEFAWQGEKQNLRVALMSPVPGVIDDYTISDFIAQPTARTTPVRTDNPQKTALDLAVHRAASLYLQHPAAVGMSIAIYQKGKETFYNYGEVEKGTGRLPTPATYYDMGSVAKTFVTTLLAQAVLDKKVQLTDDIRRYLPGQYPNLEVEGQPIRFVDLANHTSGLGGASRLYAPATKERLGKLNLADRVAHYSHYTADTLLHDLHGLRLESKPGTTYRYTGVGMLVLQLLLERVYQQPYEQLVTRYVKTRFGMHDTKRVLSAKEQQRYAIGYARPELPQAHVNYTGYWGGPNLSSTPADLMKYLRANLAEREPAVRLAHQRTRGTAPEFGLGLGWMLNSDADGNRRIYHDGSSPGYNTRFVLYPEQDLGIVILVNENISQARLTEMEEFLKQELPKPAATGK
ncbi:serine hydrolase domain-containing protein [Hymenobacter rigui]|uniref:serine hydrolase domain-containing protein n=1 Tax=Hymenobacter rigui TaxID=334424 RepID=UPI001476E083|nr:serine hydrolase domain-containing protein [Hymenobacter rigui]